MGHLGHLKSEYQDLVHRLDAGVVGLPEPAAEEAELGRRKILEILFSPEEAALAAKMPVRPAKLEIVAERTGIDATELEKGPVARVHIPRRVPYGFHGSWISDED